MAKPSKFNFEKPLAVLDDEDEKTLAAIREGVRDAQAGRIVPAKKVRKLLCLRLADLSSPQNKS
jgi:predicted transcriptional regulator